MKKNIRVYLLQLSLYAISFFGTFLPFSAQAEDKVYDPYESFNRGVYSFNEGFDIYLFKHVAKGYDYITPDRVQTGVTNFFDNLKFPTYFLSDLLQGEVSQAGEHTGRFVINTTLGLLGIFDVATGFGLKEKEEDFGLAFASYDIGPGPYVVLPFFGPSNVRDTVGLVFDTITNPLYLFSYTGADTATKNTVNYGGSALKFTQQRVNIDDAITTSREGSLDGYTFIQSSYYQYRNGQMLGENPEFGKSGTSQGDELDREMDEILKK